MKLGLRSAAIALTAVVCACGSTTSTPIEEHQPACEEDAACAVTPTPTPKDAATGGSSSGGSSSGGSSGSSGALGDDGGAGPCAPSAVCGGLSICNDPCYSGKCCDLRCTCDRDPNDPDGRLECTLQCAR